MDRRNFIKGAALSVAGAAGWAGGAGAAERPNVVVVLCDQMRRPHDLPKGARLKNYDRLAGQGVEFTRHFVSAVPCSPSRACLLTGRHMDANGVFENIGGKDQPNLDPAIPTLGHVFRKAGYRTPYFGKWHLSRKRDVLENGFEPYGFEQEDLNDRPGGPYVGTLHDGAIARGAARWLKDQAGAGPFFMVVSLVNPHDICGAPLSMLPPVLTPNVYDRPPGNFNDDLSTKPRCQREYQEMVRLSAGGIEAGDEKTCLRLLDYYHQLCRDTDRNLGIVLNAIERNQLTDNTIVIFTSDHGDMTGAHRLLMKGPFVYDENVNVPLLVRWPGVTSPGARCDALSQNVDLMPTLAAVAGAAPAGLPGHDLGPLCADPAAPGPTDHVLFSFTNNVALARAAAAAGRPGVSAPQNIRSIRTDRWVYARYFDPARPGDEEYELYDMQNDPLQMTNLAADPGCAVILRELADRLREAESGEMRMGLN